MITYWTGFLGEILLHPLRLVSILSTLTRVSFILLFSLCIFSFMAFCPFLLCGYLWWLCILSLLFPLYCNYIRRWVLGLVIVIHLCYDLSSVLFFFVFCLYCDAVCTCWMKGGVKETVCLLNAYLSSFCFWWRYYEQLFCLHMRYLWDIGFILCWERGSNGSQITSPCASDSVYIHRFPAFHTLRG